MRRLVWESLERYFSQICYKFPNWERVLETLGDCSYIPSLRSLRLSLDLNRRTIFEFDLYRNQINEHEDAGQRRKHLYLVFDDWNSGYSIRKVSLSRRSGKRSVQSSDSGEDEDSEQSSLDKGAKPKPLPVFMRVRAAPRGFPNFFTSAFGTKIMAMHPGATGDIFGVIPTVDVHDWTISFELPPNGPAFPLYIPVSDDRLFALDIGSFEVLRKQKPNGVWMWERVTYPPFSIGDVSSYGVQPNGCILVSTKSGGTFIFDAKEHVWKEYGDWVFPFTDLGHYDPSLEAFVGLSKDLETLGYLYCCTMASTTTGNTGKGLHPSPDFKCTKKKVYNEDPAEGQHVSATLVHMRRGKFCLVECICTDDTPTDQDQPRVPPGADVLDFVGGGPQGGRFMYRLKTFSLGYDRKGDLKLKDCKVHRYSLPHEARYGSICQDPVAFWL